MPESRAIHRLVPVVAALGVVGLGCALVAVGRGEDSSGPDQAPSVASLVAPATTGATEPGAAQPRTPGETVAAATLGMVDLLELLDDSERARLRGAGLPVAELDETQQAAYHRLNAGVLQQESYAAMRQSTTGSAGRDLRLYLDGDPTTPAAWRLRTRGADFDAAVTVDPADRSVIIAPVRVSFDPLETPEGETARGPLIDVYGTAFAFFDSLSERQREEIYAGTEPVATDCLKDVACSRPPAHGLDGSRLNEAQRHLLIDLAAGWLSVSDPETSAAALDEFAGRIDQTVVEWTGAKTYDPAVGRGIGVRVVGGGGYFEFSSSSWTRARSVYLRD